jgi:F0F1-type ATP synthase membrane subunit b/b'
MINLIIFLAIFALIVWVAKTSYQSAKNKERYDRIEHENRQLYEANKRFQRLIEKIEANQMQSKKRVDEFIHSIRDLSERDDINSLLEEAFGSLVNRKDMDT